MGAAQVAQQFATAQVAPLTPWAVNSYLVSGSRPILVDTGFPTDAAAIERGFHRHGVAVDELALEVRAVGGQRDVTELGWSPDGDALLYTAGTGATVGTINW